MQGTEEVRYGFTAREHDALTGLIHYRARAYDPLTGQFLQRDPIGFASGDLNLYAYVENDPYNWTDPSGEASGQYGNLARQSAQMARSAVGNISRGVLGLANGIRNALISAGPTIAAADRVAPCASAVANAATGNAGAAAADAAGCVAGSAGGRAAGEALQEARAAHNAFRDSIADRLMRRGFQVATEVTFRGAGGRATRLDLVYRTPSGVVRAIEIKTGAGRLTRNQRDIFPEIRAGTARPVGQNAGEFPGLDVGIPSGPIQVGTIRFGGR
ncbi:RHS repeat-associated core domain-containing protein [Rhodophyticola porphyridii]|uniref:RHS repeat-associated core domain-containing protein n=1 Tax=Rhodophyticola porphyridii TaxID=1852017 RepID=A0A3L9XXW8_9RHOB|nr:RHS repeat-associated core domain-containing protein [Rhodophyticola porphyridii]